MKYCYYFSKRFLGIGIMFSYKDTPITYNEQFQFDIRLGWFHFWYVKDLR